MTVTIFDTNGTNENLWKVLSSAWELDKDGAMKEPAKTGTFKLTLYDGCGCAMEEWQLNDAYFTAINFGELDYSSSEEVTVELTIKYKSVNYKPITAEYKTNPIHMGMCRNKEMTCPKCSHKFIDGNIIY